MSPNVPAKALTAREERAAGLVADDELNDDEIAATVGVKRRTLTRWRNRPEFSARVAALIQEARETARSQTIADKQYRVSQLQERHAALRQIVMERGEDSEMVGIPGGKTGYLVRTFKVIGSGMNQRTVEEYAVDTALLREFRAHEQQAAQELGEWVEKVAPTKGDGSDLDLATLLQKARALRGETGG